MVNTEECKCKCEKTEDPRFAELKEFAKQFGVKQYPKSYLIAILHKAQSLYGYLSKELLADIADLLDIPRSQIWGVATFYHYFQLTPQGKHSISVCLGTACYVKGAARVLDKIKEELKIEIGETTPDNLFTLHDARCLGSCGLAPVVLVDDKVYGEVTPQKIGKILNTYRKEG